MRVHDAYVAGEGILHPAVLGLVSLTDLRGASPGPGGVAHGEFIRFVAEAAWYPTALLPSQGAHWTAIDEHSAQVDPADGAAGISLLLRFDPRTGLIDSVRAEARGRTLPHLRRHVVPICALEGLQVRAVPAPSAVVLASSVSRP